MSERCFVAGATGYTGQEVVRALRERGVETVAHVRPNSPSVDSWRERLTSMGAQVDTTAWELLAMSETLRRCAPTHVFALLGTTRARAQAAARRGEDASAESYEKVDYGLTALLLKAALASGHRPRFVYLSAAGARDGTSNSYLAVRARLERELKESGLPFTIARPSFISGPDRAEWRAAERIASVVGDGLLSACGALGMKRLRDRYRSIDARTLAHGLVRLAFSSEGNGAVVHGEALRA